MRHNQIQILGCIVLTAVARLRHELYLKLVVTALDYSTEDTRQLLVRALTQATEPGRVYATRWLGVLARYTQISSAVKRSIGSTIGFHNHGEDTMLNNCPLQLLRLRPMSMSMSDQHSVLIVSSM